jgi:AcrR family transcriptional regulator
MEQKLDERALARQPTKLPSRARFEGVLDEAEKLLLEQGLNGFSIPVLAERLGYTRASIYHFFPTPYAMLNELSHRYFKESSTLIIELAQGFGGLAWGELIARVVSFAAEYYNARPIARMLLLGGPVTDQSFRIQEQTNEQLGAMIHTEFQKRGFVLPKEPDAAWITVDIADGILRHSQYRYDRITDQCRDEAVYAMTAYLARYTDEGVTPAGSRRRKSVR